jgi:3-oxoacyl-ACP reductase-like protein
LAKTEQEWSEIPTKNICYELLVELLAFQFASPVRWIETQNLLFAKLRTELLVEIGPAPTLFTMAKRTVEMLDAMNPFVQREILWFNRDKAKIYFEAVPELSTEGSAPSSNVLTPVVASTPAPAAVQATAPVQSAAALPDEPVAALDFIQVLVSLKSKQPLSSIGNEASLKVVSSGKSALQNELQGELEAEFEASKAALQQAGNIAELPLTQLALVVQPNYNQPGKRASDLVSKLLTRALPGGYSASQARSYLARTWGIATANRQHNVLMTAVSMEPASRLGSQSAAEDWLDKSVALYAARHNVSVSKASAASAASAPAPAFVGMAVTSPQSVTDIPPSALDVIRTIISIKMKKPIETVSASASLKDLAGGKSALQNEVVGDLTKEFGVTSEPNGVTEMDLHSLAGALTSKSGYPRLGPVSAALVARLVSTKMPAGFSHPAIKAHLRSNFGLGDGRSEAVMLRALTLEPASRLQTEGEARAFWDSTATSYANSNGLDLSSSASAGRVTQSAGVVDTQMRSDLDTLFQRQMRALQTFLDPKAGSSNDTSRLAVLQSQLNDLEAAVRMWNDEHGGAAYVDGLAPVFDSRKERVFDSYWSWVKQDCLSLFYDYACGRAPAWNLEVRNRIYHIKNRSTPEALKMVEHYKTKAEKDGFPEIVGFISMLQEALAASLSSASRYRELHRPQKPFISIDTTGSVVYKEVDRPNSKDMMEYVVEMFTGRPASLSDPQGPRVPFLFVQQSVSQKQPIDALRTDMFFNVLRKLAADGIGFAGKVALITGCGEGSIGIELLKALLSGGATVYATTSRFDGGRVAQLYQQAYNDRGAKGSRLILLPFNQASKCDIDNLVERILS